MVSAWLVTTMSSSTESAHFAFASPVPIATHRSAAANTRFIATIVALVMDARCWVLHAFDVARAIKLGPCRDCLPVREVAEARRPQWPHLFGLEQRPLVWPLEPVTV